jgi:hypothetical protein
MAFGASDIFSGAEQHIYEFSSGISQIGEWNDPSDDYVSCVLCGNYLIAALMSVDSPSETYDAIAVISSSSMTTLSTFYTLSINGEVKNVMASSNFVYAEVATDTEDIIAQFSLITPTPPSSGGGGGLATPTPTSSASPSGSGLPVSVSPAPAKLSAIEIFSIAVLSVLAGLALLAVMLHKGKRRRR